MSKNLTQPQQLPQGPKAALVCPETARFPWHTSAKSRLTMTSFPSASYMIGFASGFALHTLRRMVVLPAFALPMTRMRNWWHWRRISSGPKAPSLNGRALLDDWSADMEERRNAQWSSKTRWWSEINQCGPYRKNRVSFSRQIEAVTLILLSPSQELCRCTRMKSLMVYRLPSVWLRRVVRHSEVVHHSELPAPHEFVAAKLGWTHSWRNLLSIGEFFFSLVFPTLLLFSPFSWLNAHTVHVPVPLETTTVLISCLGP